MNPAKKGLGRGLSALFGDIEKKSGSRRNANKSKLPIADLQQNKYQPRNIFDEEDYKNFHTQLKKMVLSSQSQLGPTNMNQESLRLLQVKGDG